VRDGVLRRTIDKWLKAGVLEDGQVADREGHAAGRSDLAAAGEHLPARGAGRVVRDGREAADAGKCLLVRYADDFVMVFELEQDARRVLEVLPKRFGKYGLTLHPEKTRLIPFQRPEPVRAERPGRAGAGDLRSAGIHPLLGPESERVLGRQAQDGGQPIRTRCEGDPRVVPKAPTR
jgi:RNA-directed DNA polymerase